jgi:4'-phosphopantetheinyl transferase EntD
VTRTLIWQEANLQVYLDTVPTTWPENSSLLSEYELNYCLESQHENLQRSRAHLRLMLKEILNDPSCEVLRGPLGRPLVRADLDISFSHKEDQALVAVTKFPALVGVDIESVDQEVDWTVFKNYFLLKEDRESITHLVDVEHWNLHRAHLCLFSLKEAFFKAWDHPFQPALVGLSFLGRHQNQSHFEAHYKSGSLDSNQHCRLISLSTEKHVVSICHMPGRKFAEKRQTLDR